MTIKSFRGKLADLGIDTIPLRTNNGSTGYKIKTFQVMTGDEIGTVETANLVAIYSVPQTNAVGTADFNDNTLLAAADYRQHDNEAYGNTANVIVFDNMKFNQDIYVTNFDRNSGGSMNYYIELEVMNLDLSENTVATLKDIRNIASQ